MAKAVIAETTLSGDSLRVIMKLPPGVTQPDRGYVIRAADPHPTEALASLARQSNNGDAQVKANLQALQPGTEIDLADPAVEPPSTLTPEEAAFVADWHDLARATRVAAAGATMAGVDVPALVATVNKGLSDHPEWKRFISVI